MKDFYHYCKPLKTLTAKDLLQFVKLTPQQQINQIRSELDPTTRRELDTYLSTLEKPAPLHVAAFLINKLKEENTKHGNGNSNRI